MVTNGGCNHALKNWLTKMMFMNPFEKSLPFGQRTLPFRIGRLYVSGATSRPGIYWGCNDNP